MDVRKALKYWIQMYTACTYTGTAYVDGVKVDIATLTEMPDVLIYITDARNSFTFVKTIYSDAINGYCIHCYTESEQFGSIDIYVGHDVIYDRGLIPWCDAMYRYINREYGEEFPSNLDVLYRLLKIANSLVKPLSDGNELISRFNASSSVKRANH